MTLFRDHVCMILDLRVENSLITLPNYALFTFSSGIIRW